MVTPQYTVTINARLLPFDRDDFFGDMLERIFEEAEIARWLGAGTSTLHGEPEWSDIQFELLDDTPETRDRFINVFKDCPFFPQRLPPVGSGWMGT
jgi:hypothetical protein